MRLDKFKEAKIFRSKFDINLILKRLSVNKTESSLQFFSYKD